MCYAGKFKLNLKFQTAPKYFYHIILLGALDNLNFCNTSW